MQLWDENSINLNSKGEKIKVIKYPSPAKACKKH